ncbi:unnamed protein product [Prorocentrum cordatum]|uniref:Uncharacterized protein n=1 Tax=Prorocentrum cordatum TaxID=2364126 RepID=A0ABN9Y8U9_9DINO|nr:unnamed protein product [Polarella glacialis]
MIQQTIREFGGTAALRLFKTSACLSCSHLCPAAGALYTRALLACSPPLGGDEGGALGSMGSGSNFASHISLKSNGALCHCSSFLALSLMPLDRLAATWPVTTDHYCWRPASHCWLVSHALFCQQRSCCDGRGHRAVQTRPQIGIGRNRPPQSRQLAFSHALLPAVADG